MKKIILSSLLATAVFISGCLKDKDFDNLKLGIPETGVKGVGFKSASNSLALNANSTPQTIVSIIVGLNAPTTSATPINYTVVAAPTLIPTGVTLLPASAYTFSATGTIPAGQYFDTLEVVIPNASVLDPNQTYGFGLSITSTDPGFVVIANSNNTVVTFNVKNKYDGKYSVTGSMVHVNPLWTGNYPREYQLVTAGANSVHVMQIINGELLPGYLFLNNGAGSFFGSFGYTLFFDPVTDKVIEVRNYYGDPANASTTVGNTALGSGAPNYANSANGRRAVLDPTGENSYVNGVIKVKISLIQPSVNGTNPAATITETMTYIGPR